MVFLKGVKNKQRNMAQRNLQRKIFKNFVN